MGRLLGCRSLLVVLFLGLALLPAMANPYWLFVGNLILIFGQKFSRIASLIKVNEPLIKAWLAIMAAAVAIIIPKSVNQSGIKLYSTFSVSVSKVFPLK